jgi:RNA polymerase sigma-70 factor (ECF subfamily)
MAVAWTVRVGSEDLYRQTVSGAERVGTRMSMEAKRDFVADLALTHGQHLRRYLARRVRNRCDIPDIIQEVFLRLLCVPNQESIRSPEAYLFTVARHVAQQHVLRESVAPGAELNTMLSGLTAAGDPAAGDPVLEISALECLEGLEQALEDLTPKARAAFLFHRRDGLTLDEIGIRLGVSRPMAKKYLAKALVQFRKRLDSEQRS